MIARSALVARYTLVEQRRRRLLLAFVVLEVVLAAGLGIAPYVIGSGSTGEERALALLSTLSGTLSPALYICALAVGMTVVRQDVDSGALTAILAKPLSRAGYAAGKLLAALSLLAFVAAVFAACCSVLLLVDGGGYVGSLALYLVAQAANAALLMVIVMALTVSWNGVVAALAGLAVILVDSVVATLHAFGLHGAWRPVVDVAYTLLPRALETSLTREVFEASARLHPGSPSALPPGSIPAASSPADIVAWAAWLTALSGLMVVAVQRRDV